jgi:hypothetical protein
VKTPKEPTTMLGKCRDCANGMGSAAHHAFNLYVDDDGQERHWYCTYCGSNHVTILDAEGNTIFEFGDLYDDDEPYADLDNDIYST